MYRGCAAEHGPSQRQAKRSLEQESMANTVVEEAWRQILFGAEAERYGARRDTQSLRVGESSFMQQR